MALQGHFVDMVENVTVIVAVTELSLASYLCNMRKAIEKEKKKEGNVSERTVCVLRFLCLCMYTT